MPLPGWEPKAYSSKGQNASQLAIRPLELDREDRLRKEFFAQKQFVICFAGETALWLLNIGLHSSCKYLKSSGFYSSNNKSCVFQSFLLTNLKSKYN
ncbi:hypothetical protein CEXT_276271 [Caerostris extrusa]|uniref:Uncharacterized protein n=1 Tax=Caerostris extrusa TaxID=172846 RepID=A0AAV4Y0C9_CAEEX|nr:hypothetical protein CEXT_276271 [Caerostris extrusa]